jgi:hypothetical protein
VLGAHCVCYIVQEALTETRLVRTALMKYWTAWFSGNLLGWREKRKKERETKEKKKEKEKKKTRKKEKERHNPAQELIVDFC